MRYIVAIASLYFSFSALCQSSDSCEVELEGTILSEDTKEPLPYVKVAVGGTDKAMITDSLGQFYFSGLCDEDNTLIISCFGFCDTTCESHHQHGKSPHIFLKKKVNALRKVTISVDHHKDGGFHSLSHEELGKDELMADPTQTMAEALSKVEGVTLISTGSNVQLPVIHGLYGNRILILNNGLKHGFQNWGTDHGPEIDLSSANSIKVVKGAAGVRYGPEALGGVIIVDADHLHLKEPFAAEVTTGYQTNGRGYFVSSSMGMGRDRWSWHLGSNYVRLGDRHAPGYLLTNTGKEEIAFNGGVRYKVANWDANIYYSYIDQDLGILRSSIAHSGNSLVQALSAQEPAIINPFSYNIQEPNQVSTHQLAKAEVDWWYSDDAKLTVRLGRQFNQRKEFDVRRNAHKPIIDLDLTTDDFQLEWKHPDWARLDGVIGFQTFQQDNDNNPGTGTTPFIPNYNTLRYSGFIVESLNKGEHTVELGIRVDMEDNNVRGRETNQDIFRDQYRYSNITTSIGYVKKVSDKTTIRSNFGSAWRLPNVMELFSYGQRGYKTTFGLLRYYFTDENQLKTDRVLNMAASEVLPEKGFKFINEWSRESDGHALLASLYGHYIENFVFEKPIAILSTIRGPMPFFIYDQKDAAFVGVDFTWKEEWSKDINGKFGTHFLWSRNITDNSPLINQPPVRLNYELSWIKELLPFTEDSKISVSPSYTFTQFWAPRTIHPQDIAAQSVELNADSEIFDFQDAPGGYFLLDANWTFSWKRFKTSFSVKNILNNSYRDYLDDMRYFADQPGRNFLITLNYSIQNH